MRKAQLFIVGTGVAMAAIGYFLVSMNKGSLGAISITTYIGIIAMAVAIKISGFLLGAKQPHSDGKLYGNVMDWAMLIFVWPSYVTPLVVMPFLATNHTFVLALFGVGILLFVVIALWGLKISNDRITGKRRHSKWYYFIPAFLYTIPALIIGYFVAGKFSTNLIVMRIANLGGLLLGALFSFYCIRLALFDLFDYEVRKYRVSDLLPLVGVVVGVAVVAEFALPLLVGKNDEMYLLYSLSIFALVCAQILGVLSVTRRAKF